MTLPSGRCCVLPCIISFEFALSKSWMFCSRCPSDTRSWFLTKCRNWVVVQNPTDVKNVTQCAFVSISIFTFPSPRHYEVQFLAFVITLKLRYQCWCIGLLCLDIWCAGNSNEASSGLPCCDNNQQGWLGLVWHYNHCVCSLPTIQWCQH